MYYVFLPLLIGYLLDLILGDPHSIWHPVCGIGTLISKTEKYTREWLPKTKKGENIAGLLLVIVVILVSCGIPAILLWIGYRIHIVVGGILQSIMCYQLLATKSLKDESMKVYDALKYKTIEDARYTVSMIVGRDTNQLDEIGVTKAAVETVAENTSDGIIAPMIYMAIGGPILGFFYKAINTMDSCVGYKNEKYRYYGTVAAKLDDLVNYIPARISSWVMILATVFTTYNTKNAIRIYRRDRYQHASPNSAHTEAVTAGALEVQLAGNAYYFGKLYEKPTIGDAIRPVEVEDIRRANQLLYLTSALMMVILAGVTILIQYFVR